MDTDMDGDMDMDMDMDRDMDMVIDTDMSMDMEFFASHQLKIGFWTLFLHRVSTKLPYDPSSIP